MERDLAIRMLAALESLNSRLDEATRITQEMADAEEARQRAEDERGSGGGERHAERDTRHQERGDDAVERGIGRRNPQTPHTVLIPVRMQRDEVQQHDDGHGGRRQRVTTDDPPLAGPLGAGGPDVVGLQASPEGRARVEAGGAGVGGGQRHERQGEVSDALVAYRKSQDVRTQQQLLTDAAQDATRLSNMRYQGGATSYLEVLDSETRFFSAQLALAQAQLREIQSVVQIYRSLGGGWQQ